MGTMVSRIKEAALALMLSIAIPVSIVQFIPNDPAMAAYIRGSRLVSTTINSDVWVEMHDDSYPTNKVTIYFVNSGTNETSTISTLLVQANRPYNQCFAELNKDITYKSLDLALKEIVAAPLPRACNNKQVTLKVDQSYANIVNHAITSKKYKVEFVHE
jgi:hypothetical protein